MIPADRSLFQAATSAVRRNTRARALILFVIAFVIVQVPGNRLAAVADITPTHGASLAELKASFLTPPEDCKIMMRWWWFGPSVSNDEIEREMRTMKEGGIGGFEVQPVYPLSLDDETRGIKNLPYLSDGFIDALRFTSRKANELGVRMDLTLGSGWPFGGPTVSAADAAAKLRVERVKLYAGADRVKLPPMDLTEKLIAAFALEQLESGKPRYIEATEIRDGAAWLPRSTRPSELLFFIASHTGQQVKRAALGAEGFVVNHLDRDAAERYLSSVGERLMTAFGSSPPQAIFCDSLEAYENDWTNDFLDEFKRRRGYDLKPYLPALAAYSGDQTTAVRHDWGKTLTELLNERFLAPLHDWSRKHGTLLRIQSYGVPAASLSGNRYADLSEGEGSQWKTLSATRWASSASHVYEQPVTSSETWTWLHSPVFRATPLDMKAEADLHFLQGVNQLIGHGWPYTPPGIEYPGWRFYAAGVFNEKNPWWIAMPDITKYFARVSFVLRQGEAANDVGIYLPNDDAWADFSTSNISLIESLRKRLGQDLIPQLLQAGYNFDFLDDDALKLKGRVENGRLILGRNQFRIIVLPNVERMSVETLSLLEKFVDAGGKLIATRQAPHDAPGMMATATERGEIEAHCKRLFSGPGAKGVLIRDESAQLASVLHSNLSPDMACEGPNPEIGFVHRTTSDAEIYFIVNTDSAPVKTEASFRVSQKRAEWWDPLTGDFRDAPSEVRGNRTRVSLELQPYESRVLVFSNKLDASASKTSDGAREPASLDLSSGWQLSFDDEKLAMERLRSWTELKGRQYYSGVATYERPFTIDPARARGGGSVRLEFGQNLPLSESDNAASSRGYRANVGSPVREAAVVLVNGRRVGSVWCPPWSIDVSRFLKVGENRLQVLVGNTAINYMAGHALPDYRLLNQRYGERFQPQDMDEITVLSSGLLGPIRLVWIEK